MNKIKLKNFKIKIVVVIIALLIWFYVETENNYKFSFEIPIKINNLSPRKIIVNEIPYHVKITLWGRGRELLTLLLSRKFQYNLDLINENKSKILALSKNNVRFPQESDIEVLNILEPDSIYLEIENIDKKKVPIKPEIDIHPLPGYAIVGGINLDPDSVLVIGAESQLDSVFFIKTEPLVHKNVKRDLKKKIKLINSTVKYVWLDRNEVNFYVDIQKLLEKPLVEISINVINVPDNVEVTVVPSSLSLTLIGGADRILTISNKDINAYIDYHKARASKEKYCLAYIDKPNDIRIKDIKPKKFKLIVKKYQ